MCWAPAFLDTSPVLRESSQRSSQEVAVSVARRCPGAALLPCRMLHGAGKTAVSFLKADAGMQTQERM